ncbi:MAG: DUF922 domain-containing protein [Flavobacteriaceae bacterium]|nr:DUF922 domain-containing protein [Flavobacteriaceae bacterium]
MKLITAALLLFFIFPSEVEEEKIRWQEDRRLTWSDFKGTPNGAEEYVASTNSGVSFSFSYTVKNGKDYVNYSVNCNFYPQLSWYRPERVNEYILKHEQAHFDISELHARKLRLLLSDIPKDENFKEIAGKLYHKMEDERRAMQERFDSDSDHSNIKLEEFRWREYISEQLAEYDPWK